MRGERWSHEHEIKNELALLQKNQPGGLVVYTDNDSRYGHTKEGHQIILGSSGCGKSRRGTIPQTRALLEAGESVVCVDPKGEIYNYTACYAKKYGYEIKVINFREPSLSDRWNPLLYIWDLNMRGDVSQAQQMTQELVNSITGSSISNDHFWTEAMRNLLSGIINLLIQLANREQCCISKIIDIISEDWTSLNKDDRDVTGGLLEKVANALPPNAPTRRLITFYTALTAMTTRSCVMSETINVISTFCSTQDIITMTSYDDLNIADMDAAKPFIYYFILPDESAIFDKLSALLVSQLTTHYIGLADKKYNGKLPNRLNIVLEELGNIGASLQNLPHLMSASRSRNVRITIVLQSITQLFSIYDRAKGETILANCSVWMCFRTSSFETLEILSQRCGYRKIKAGSLSAAQPLISPQQLDAMEIGQALVIINGKVKFITALPDYTEIFDCKNSMVMQLPKAQTNEQIATLSLSDLLTFIAIKNIEKRKESRYKKLLEGCEHD